MSETRPSQDATTFPPPSTTPPPSGGWGAGPQPGAVPSGWQAPGAGPNSVPGSSGDPTQVLEVSSVAPAVPQAHVTRGPGPTPASATASIPKSRGPRGGVGLGSMILLLVAAILTVPAVSTWWVRSTVRSPGAVEDLASTLHRDQDLADSLAETIATSLVGKSNVDDVHPDEMADLRDSISDGITDASFDQSWRRAVRNAHRGAVSVMDGRRSSNVYLELDELADRLERDGFHLDPEPDSKFHVIVLKDDYSGQVRSTSQLIGRLAWMLPLGSLAALLAGVAWAKNRVRGVAIYGVALAVVAAISVLVTAVVPGAIVSAATTDSVRSAVLSVVDAAAGNLVKVLVVVLVVGLGAAAVALLVERQRRLHQPPPVAWPGA